MKRLAIFAGYDKDKIIDDYIIYYLKELKKVADIIFVYDNDFSKKELNKIKNLTIHQICKRHREYDFGSYKRGYVWAKEQSLLKKYDVLILCNDSVYGPFYPLINVLKKMENKQNIDFWGFTKNMLVSTPHIQSYFISINKKTFLAKPFDDFINSIKIETERKNIVQKYEYKLTEILNSSGAKDASFFDEKRGCFEHDPAKNWKKMINKGYPFIKRTLFTRNPYNLRTLNSYKKCINNIYPKFNTNNIENNLNRYKIKEFSLIKTLKNRGLRRFFIQIKLNKNEIIIRLFGIYLIKRNIGNK